MTESVTVFLSSLSAEELNSIPKIIAGMKKDTRELELQEKIEAGIEMYNQLNILGKRMYTVNQCAEYVKVGKNKLAKAITLSEKQSIHISTVELANGTI